MSQTTTMTVRISAAPREVRPSSRPTRQPVGRAGQELLACGGQAKAAGGSVQKLGAKLGLKLGHIFRRQLGRHPQPRREAPDEDPV